MSQLWIIITTSAVILTLQQLAYSEAMYHGHHECDRLNELLSCYNVTHVPTLSTDAIEGIERIEFIRSPICDVTYLTELTAWYDLQQVVIINSPCGFNCSVQADFTSTVQIVSDCTPLGRDNTSDDDVTEINNTSPSEHGVPIDDVAVTSSPTSSNANKGSNLGLLAKILTSSLSGAFPVNGGEANAGEEGNPIPVPVRAPVTFCSPTNMLLINMLFQNDTIDIDNNINI